MRITTNMYWNKFILRRENTFTPLRPGSPYCPVTLGFLHLARRGVFQAPPVQAWIKKEFLFKDEVNSWPFLRQVDCSTQTLTVSTWITSRSRSHSLDIVFFCKIPIESTHSVWLHTVWSVSELYPIHTKFINKLQIAGCLVNWHFIVWDVLKDVVSYSWECHNGQFYSHAGPN